MCLGRDAPPYSGAQSVQALLFFFQAEDGIRDTSVTGVQTCALPISPLLGKAPLTNDVYFQIGLVTLLGLAAKNAILIVEFALMKSQEGLSVSAASVEAARLRFRPILMTSLAFILGVSPLAFSSGAGAGARHSVGTGVMGGMLAATFLAIFFVPFFFKMMMERRFGEPRSSEELKREAAHHREMALRPATHETIRAT